MIIHHSWDDLPERFPVVSSIAIDTETLGLEMGRDRLCVVQVSPGNQEAYLVQFAPHQTPSAPRLKSLLADPSIQKIFHFGRFDIGMLYQSLGILCQNVYCTKIASRLARTYTDRHGLRDLCRELLGIDLSKAEQSSDWGAEALTDEQKKYAARDVLYLHALQKKLTLMLEREGRRELADTCFDFLPHRARLDVAGWTQDIFSHV
jgi:ribonuclease D